MGCGTSTQGSPRTKHQSGGGEMSNTEKSTNIDDTNEIKPRLSLKYTEIVTAMKAALLIQRWYRRYIARLEARRRATWSIFQSLEYAGEQDQLRLYNFFNDAIGHLQSQKAPSKAGSMSDLVGSTTPNGNNIMEALSFTPRPSSRLDSLEEEDAELLKLTDPKDITVPLSYKGPHIKFPLSMNQIESLIDAFKRKQTLHAKYILELLHETRKVLKRLPNISQASTSIAKQITVCGDLHGKIDDLFIILYKNGLPAVDNPYVFNGDFVDRGPNSVEIAVLLFACLLVQPNEIYINRGNHEDHVMNLRYGFIKEVMSKYKEHATKVVRLFEDVFSWLPLATVVDQKVLVAHGGISSKTDLEYLSKIDRHKYLSALRPPVLEEEDTDGAKNSSSDKPNVDLKEWRQVLDILWSDPKAVAGCTPNTFRGGGSYFGPDITDKILRRHNLHLLIRSHECKPEGYEYTHNNQVLTIFSASNYYEVGSNKGAYLKLDSDLKCHFVQYMATKGHLSSKVTIKQRVSYVEDSAMRSLRNKICAFKTSLVDEFQKYDPANLGLIKVSEWCQVMSDTLNMDLPWRSLRPHIVTLDPQTGLVEYHSTFEELKVTNRWIDENETPNINEALYRHKDNLETIFRAIDKDNSGLISMEEFEEACTILSAHAQTPMSTEDIREMGKAIDRNKDGNIDINEFLEAFRIVDKFGKEMKRKSVDSGKSINVNGDAVIDDSDQTLNTEVFETPEKESDPLMKTAEREEAGNS